MKNPHYEFEGMGDWNANPYAYSRTYDYPVVCTPFSNAQIIQDTAPLYDDQGMMEANRLKELIGKFQDKPAIVSSLQRQLDQVLGAQSAPQSMPQARQVYDSEPDGYAADQGMFDTPAGYTQRAGNADKWANVNPNVKAFLAKKGATSADQIAYEKNQAYLNSVQRYVPQGNDVLVSYDNSDQIRNAGNDVADFDNTINYVGNDNAIVDNRRSTRKYSEENASLSPFTSDNGAVVAANTPKDGYRKVSLNISQQPENIVQIPYITDGNNYQSNFSVEGSSTPRAEASSAGGNRGGYKKASWKNLKGEGGMNINWNNNYVPPVSGDVPTYVPDKEQQMLNWARSWSWSYADRQAKQDWLRANGYI